MYGSNPGCVGLIGPDYPMLRDVTLTTMLDILKDKRIPYSLPEAGERAHAPSQQLQNSVSLARAL
jgi:hypothetical protein